MKPIATRAKMSVTLAVCAGLVWGGAAQAQEPIKVGILHSLSGTMAISETTLKDVMLMLIEEQNKKGGVLGRQLEPVVVDQAAPLAGWELPEEFATLRRLLDPHSPDEALFCGIPGAIKLY